MHSQTSILHTHKIPIAFTQSFNHHIQTFAKLAKHLENPLILIWTKWLHGEAAVVNIVTNLNYPPLCFTLITSLMGKSW